MQKRTFSLKVLFYATALISILVWVAVSYFKTTHVKLVIVNDLDYAVENLELVLAPSGKSYDMKALAPGESVTYEFDLIERATAEVLHKERYTPITIVYSIGFNRLNPFRHWSSNVYRKRINEDMKNQISAPQLPRHYRR